MGGADFARIFAFLTGSLASDYLEGIVTTLFNNGFLIFMLQNDVFEEEITSYETAR